MFEKTKKTNTIKWSLTALSILLFGIFDCINMYKIPSIYQTIYTQLEVEPILASWLMTSYSFTATILAIPTGWLCKKLGYKKLLAIGISLSIIGSLIGSIAFNLSQFNIQALLIGRILEGTCYIFSSVCIPIIIQRILPKEHIGTIMGIWAIRVPIACFIGESTTPIFVEKLGLSSAWIVFCILVLITSIIMILVINKNSKVDTKEKAKNNNTDKNINYFKTYINFLLFLLSFVSISIIQAGILDYTPTILQTRFDIDGALSGILTSLTMIISIASSLVFGFLCDKFKTYKYVYIFGCVLMGPGALLMYTCSGPLFVTGQILLGIGLGAPAVSANAVFEILDPKHHSIGIGIGMAAFSLGQVLGSWITQIILANTFENIYICGICLLVTGIIGTAFACFSKTRAKTKSK